MKKFKKVYVEIGNVCNLDCEFCPKTKREAGLMSLESFKLCANKILPYTDYIYLHIMGEPLMHPQLEAIIKYCAQIGLRVCITTNGTLIGKMGDMLIQSGVHRVNISLHSFEGNENSVDMEGYIADIIRFAKHSGDTICSLRLWNINGASSTNSTIFAMLERGFGIEDGIIEREIVNSFSFGNKVFLQLAQRFDWPDSEGENIGDNGFCYGLRDQMGVLVDGSVVPCCLDHEGDITLGNIFNTDIDEILNSDRAKNIYEGFSKRRAVEELCKRCGYRTRF